VGTQGTPFILANAGVCPHRTLVRGYHSTRCMYACILGFGGTVRMMLGIFTRTVMRLCEPGTHSVNTTRKRRAGVYPHAVQAQGAPGGAH
jgi:hypothetical protein